MTISGCEVRIIMNKVTVNRTKVNVAKEFTMGEYMSEIHYITATIFGYEVRYSINKGYKRKKGNILWVKYMSMSVVEQSVDE